MLLSTVCCCFINPEEEMIPDSKVPIVVPMSWKLVLSFHRSVLLWVSAFLAMTSWWRQCQDLNPYWKGHSKWLKQDFGLQCQFKKSFNEFQSLMVAVLIYQSSVFTHSTACILHWYLTYSSHRQSPHLSSQWLLSLDLTYLKFLCYCLTPHLSRLFCTALTSFCRGFLLSPEPDVFAISR